MDWDGQERRQHHGWHLKREISLGHIITTATIAISGVGYVVQNEKNHSTHAARLDALQTIVLELKTSDIRQDSKLENAVGRLETRFGRLEDKLDRVLSRGPR